MRWLLAIAIAAGCSGGRSPSASEASTLRWEAPIEVARGGGERGAWRQNESDYDYVDDPSVALDASGNTAVMWVDQETSDVYFQRYAPGGAPILPRAVDVSRTPDVFSWLPRLALRGDDVYVLWQEIVFSGGSHGGDILFARSRDGGRTFEPPLNLSRSRAGDGKGRITADVWHNGSLDLAIAGDGALVAAWTTYEGTLYVARSSDDGASFGAPVPLHADGPPARAPTLATHGLGAVYLAWTVGEDVAADVRLARSTDGGKTFAPALVVAHTPGYSDAPKLAADAAGVLHLVWAEGAGGPFGRYDIRYARSRDAGATFEDARVLSRPVLARSQTGESAAFPMLALDGGHVYVVWELFTAGSRMSRGLGIIYSRDGGATFGAPSLVAHSIDPAGGYNGSHQGRLMTKLAARDGRIVVANSALAHGHASRVWIVYGTAPGAAARRM